MGCYVIVLGCRVFSLFFLYGMECDKLFLVVVVLVVMFCFCLVCVIVSGLLVWYDCVSFCCWYLVFLGICCVG